LGCVGTAGEGCGWDAGFVAQQAIWSQQAAQLPIAGFTQTGEADTDMDAICIHTSSMLNKMAVNCFTT
jgi:hypothetical protein